MNKDTEWDHMPSQYVLYQTMKGIHFQRTSRDMAQHDRTRWPDSPYARTAIDPSMGCSHRQTSTPCIVSLTHQRFLSDQKWGRPE